MILVFGGTTEGRKAVAELEEAGQRFFYATKTGEQAIALHHGVRLDGAMDREAMTRCCLENNIQLLIDAAHPFAEVLHQTVAAVAEALHLPAIRFERLYPERAADIVWCRNFDEAVERIATEAAEHTGHYTLLATTGVQTIGRLKPLEQRGVRLVYRILQRQSSIDLAHRQGATDDQLCFYAGDGIGEETSADAILMKESGLTGGFAEKADEARRRGMRIYAIERPATPAVFHKVNGEHGLRRMVERLLPDFFPLKSGLTTGTCATAAALAATRRLLTGETPSEVMVTLPNGEQIPVAVGYGPDYAYVIKESGDDPDVTNGIEVRARCEMRKENFKMRNEKGGMRNENEGMRNEHEGMRNERGVHIGIEGGEGIGRFTLPGFDYPPGEPAINRVPRQMIRENLTLLLSHLNTPLSFGEGLGVRLFIPNGAAIAQRTFNPRLGIEGGISIVGVSGIIKPFSEEAFIDSIRKCLQVAKASGTERVVINSGAKSERYVRQRYPDLPQQAFVEYGNYIGQTLQMAHELDIRQVTLGVMLGKAVKLAEGQLDTHSRRGTMNRDFIAELLRESGADEPTQRRAREITLARELWDFAPPAFSQVVIAHCHRHCAPLLPNGQLTILLIDEEGRIYSGDDCYGNYGRNGSYGNDGNNGNDGIPRPTKLYPKK